MNRYEEVQYLDNCESLAERIGFNVPQLIEWNRGSPLHEYCEHPERYDTLLPTPMTICAVRITLDEMK